jgi:hypothetical protein
MERKAVDYYIKNHVFKGYESLCEKLSDNYKMRIVGKDDYIESIK